MEKIFLVVNAHKPHATTINFACRIASLAQTKITAIFIENAFYDYIPAGGLESPTYFTTVEKIRNDTVTADTEQTIRILKEECSRNGVPVEIHVDKGNPVQEIIFESRFADLLIIDPDISFYSIPEGLPSQLVKEILARAECPVMIAPEKFEDIEEIVFCYDASASSVFAIKLFTYLFPELYNKKVVLLEVNKSGKEIFYESHRRMMDWLRAHYKLTYYHSLKGDVKDELFTYLFMKRKKMIVMGAYGRSIISQFFKQSSADLLLRSVDLPLFITHY